MGTKISHIVDAKIQYFERGAGLLISQYTNPTENKAACALLPTV